MTAAYRGTEIAAYHWNLNNAPITGAGGRIYSPSEAGSCTVTVSADGFNVSAEFPKATSISSSAFAANAAIDDPEGTYYRFERFIIRCNTGNKAAGTYTFSGVWSKQ